MEEVACWGHQQQVVNDLLVVKFDTMTQNAVTSEVPKRSKKQSLVCSHKTALRFLGPSNRLRPTQYLHLCAICSDLSTTVTTTTIHSVLVLVSLLLL